MADAGPIFPRRVTADVRFEEHDCDTDYGDEGPSFTQAEVTFLQARDGWVLVHSDHFPDPFWMIRAESDYDEEDGFFCWEIQCPPWEKNTPYIDSLRGRVFVKEPL